MNQRRGLGEALIRVTCFTENCPRLQRSRGKDQKGRRLWDKVCDFHHRLKYEIPSPWDNPKYRKSLFQLKHIPNLKCERCGWDKGPCDRHRLKPELGYVPGNVVILCPNCHRLENLEKK